jgi:hypothetical protein
MLQGAGWPLDINSKLAGLAITNFSNSGTNGGIQIGTLILKWGKTYCGRNSNTTITFTKSFTNACLGVQVTMETSNDTDSEMVGVNSITAHSMRLMNGEGGDRNLFWFAWGY